MASSKFKYNIESHYEYEIGGQLVAIWIRSNEIQLCDTDLKLHWKRGMVHSVFELHRI